MCKISDVKAVFGFMRLKGVGVNRANRAIEAYRRSLEYGSGLDMYLLSLLTKELKEEFEILCDMEVPIRYSSSLNYSMVIDDSYPDSLRKLLRLSTPPVLTMLGNENLLKKKKVAFSGSRKVSNIGIDVTRDCVSQLTLNPNVSIVSGYAQGVDKIAHRTALEHGGSTIIVLPNGMSEFYVRKDLEDVWDWNRVLVVSEYLPEDKWSVGRAMNRNKTIIGLSDALMVIEAGNNGGSLDAGKNALAAGVPLFVPRYSTYPDSAAGNEMLLQCGALPIFKSRKLQRANIESVLTKI